MARPVTSPGLDGFIPEVWVAAIQAPYEKSLVYAQPTIVNDQYTGEIANVGDTVHFSAISAPTVRDYDVLEPLEYEQLEVATNSLKIDQGKYFAFYVNDTDEVQAAGPYRDPAVRAAAQKLRAQTDSYVGQKMVNDAGSKLGNVDIARASENDLWDVLIDMRTALNKEGVPTDGRFVILGPESEAAALRTPGFVKVNEAGTDDALRQGVIGRLAGFDVLVSPDAPVKSGREGIVAGNRDAVWYAQQILKVESNRSERQFADYVRGLNVFGADVIRPEAMASAWIKVNKTADAPAGNA